MLRAGHVFLHPHRGRSRRRAWPGWSTADPRLRRDRCRRPGGRRCGGGRTASRAWRRSSCSQQLSVASAAAVWGRLTRGVRSLPSRRPCCARARPKLAARRPVGGEDPHPQGDREGDRQGRASISLRSPQMPRRRGACAADRLHGIGPWTADIYLLFCLGHADAWPAGDLALQEAARLAFALEGAADDQGDGAARGSLAAVARGGGAAALDLLSRPSSGASGAPIQATIAQPIQARDANRHAEEQWLSSTVRGSSRARVRRASWWCSCTATAPTATTSSRSAAPGRGCMPQAAFVSPHAPEPCGQAPVGRQWFPLTFRDPNERWLGVNKAAPVLEQIPRRRAHAPQPSALGARAGRLQPGHHDGAA